MSDRREEYRRHDGTWSMDRRRDVILVPAMRIVRMAQDLDPETPSIYYLGTAQHETNFATNERDTEPNGFQSWGLFQLSDAERTAVGMPGADMLDPLQAMQIFVKLTQRRRDKLRLAAKVVGHDPPDLWPYVAIAHNQGEAAAMATIERYGMDWAAYRARNPRIRIVSSGYGDDVRPN